MSNNLNPNQALFTAARLGVQARMGIGRTEQPQSQSRPQAGASTLMNSRSAAHQSHQLYPIPSNAQVQSQVQFRQSHPSQPTGSSTPQDTRPNDNPNTILNQFLNQLHDQQRHFTESLAKRDKYLEALISSVCSIRETAAGLTKKSEAHDGILEKLERNSRGDDKVTNAKMVEVMKVLVGEMKGFKKTLGKSCDGDDGRTVLGRLDAVTFAVGELLERARDPEANLSEPSAPTTISPVIDLTMSRSPSPPPVRRTSPVQSRTYADVGTSPVPSSPPFKEKSFASIQVGTSPRPSSDPFGSVLQLPAESTPYLDRFSSAHTLVDDTITNPDLGFTALTREKLELAAPTPMEVDPVDPTELTLDSQICASSTVSTNGPEDAIRVQTRSNLSENASSPTAKVPLIETIHTAVHPATHTDLASPEDAQPLKNIASLDESTHKNDKPLYMHDAGLLSVALGPRPGISAFKQPYISASASTPTPTPTSTSSASPASTPTPFVQQRHADKAVAALRASISRLQDPYLGVVNSSVREGKQKEQSQKQEPRERLELPLSTRSDETLSLDDMTSERLTVAADGRSPKEEKVRATQRALDKEGKDRKEERKRIGKQASVSGLVDLTQHIRARPRSSSSPRFASPSTSTSTLSGRGRAGFRLGIDPSEDISVSSRLSSNTKVYSLTMPKVLVGAGEARSPEPVVHAAAAPLTTLAAASLAAASNSTRTAVTTPIKKAASVVPSQSALRPTTNAGLVTAAPTIRPPATIITSPVISPTKIITPAASESSRLEASVTAVFDKPPSQVSILPAATSSITTSREITAITPTKNSTPSASSRLYPLASPAAVFNKPLPPSQASSNATADEASVSNMLTEKENGNDEGGSEDLFEKTTEKIEPKMAKRIFEKEEEEEEAEKEEEEEEEEAVKQGDHLPSLSLPPPLSPSISVSPRLSSAKVSVPPPQPSVLSTPRPGSGPSFTLLPRSPVASAAGITSKNQTGTTPEVNAAFSLSPLSSVTCTPRPTRNAYLVPSPTPTRLTRVGTPSDARPDSPLPLVVVVSSSCSPPAIDLENDQPDQRHSQIPIPTKIQDDSRGQDEAIEKLMERNDETDELYPTLEEQEHHDPLQPQSPLFSSPSVTNNISIEQREEEEEGSEEGVALKLKSPTPSRRQTFVLDNSDESSRGTTDAAIIATTSKAASASSQMPTQTRASIETLLSQDLSPISDAEEKGKAKEIDKTQVSDNSLRKRYTSIGDDADIVRVKKRKVSEGSSLAEHGMALEKAGLAAKEKNVKKEVVDNPEVQSEKTGLDVNTKKPSRLNLKAGKKGESVAVTRVKKRKVNSEVVIEGEVEGEGDGLNQERPLKRARQRVEELQMTTMEPLEKGRRLTRESSGSSFGVGTSTRVKPRSSTSTSANVRKETTLSKGTLSAKEHGKVEVEWPNVAQGDDISQDLVECRKCKSSYHYGCVGIATGDSRLQKKKKYSCPPCQAGITIQKLNTNSDCWRPGCIIPTGYVVERIIGRYRTFVGGQRPQFKYLLRWKGYSLSESTWEPEESMFDPPFMIDKFRMDALEEGIDIDKEKTALILLRVAKDPCVPKAT